MDYSVPLAILTGGGCVLGGVLVGVRLVKVGPVAPVYSPPPVIHYAPPAPEPQHPPFLAHTHEHSGTTYAVVAKDGAVLHEGADGGAILKEFEECEHDQPIQFIQRDAQGVHVRGRKP